MFIFIFIISKEFLYRDQIIPPAYVRINNWAGTWGGLREPTPWDTDL
jgi:hypothetical protein